VCGASGKSRRAEGHSRAEQENSAVKMTPL
jgi:hypothetical protein